MGDRERSQINSVKKQGEDVSRCRLRENVKNIFQRNEFYGIIKNRKAVKARTGNNTAIEPQADK
jgi:hypothetical protein